MRFLILVLIQNKMVGKKNNSFEQKIHFLEVNSKYFCEVKKIASEMAKKNLPVVITCDDFLLRKWFSFLICYFRFNDLTSFYSYSCSKNQDSGFRDGLKNFPENSILFLDRIEMISSSNQDFLIELIENGFFETRNIKVLCGTSFDLNYLSETGKFNKKLAFRLNLLRIRLLSLNENRSDIKNIAKIFFQESKNVTGLNFTGFSENCISAMENHFWNGGSFELKASIERAFAVGHLPTITAGDLGLSSNTLGNAVSDTVERDINSEDKTLKSALDSFKRYYVKKILEENGNNQTKAAKVLGLQRTYLSRLISELDIR